jgi:hypothetical protein
MQAVDEAWCNFFFIHKENDVFPQVSRMLGSKVFFYPQPFPQAVHKQGPLVHKLSTGVRGSRVGACPIGG